MLGRSPRSYLWATLVFFAFSLLGHWFFGWRSFVHEAEARGQPAAVGEYMDEMARDTFENWQSEFLQLIWQVCGLALFLYVGSPQSKEGTERVEAKLDYLLSRTPGGDEVRRQLDRSFLREA